MGFASFQGALSGGSPLSPIRTPGCAGRKQPLRRRSSCSLGLCGLFLRPANEAHEIAGAKLSDLPKFGLNDRHGAYKTAETRSVHGQDYGHVSGKIHRSDGICVVVNVRGMQPCFPTILARPPGLRPDEPNACARRIVVNFPIRREEHINVFLREKIRSAMRAIEDADLPVIIVAGRRVKLCEITRSSRFCELQDVAGAENPSSMATELPKSKG